jgi:hypothetical protein
MASRVTIAPVNLNASATTPGLWLVAGSYGYDTGSPGGTLTAWSGVNGVQFANTGNMVLAYAVGATLSTAEVLVGRKAGAGLLPANTAVSITLAATTTGWIGPFSVQDYTQTDGTQYSSSVGGIISGPPSGVGLTCIDFTSTTTLSVRLYQLIPALP